MKVRESGPRVTYEDLRKVPENLIAEILDGELVTAPRPAPRHARVASVIAGQLHGPFDGPADGPGRPGGWWILFEPELHLAADVVVPDLAGWRRERLPRLPADEAFFSQAPDWACEVASPHRAEIDRARKMPIYAREQVANLWLVDPQEHLLEVFRVQGDHWLLVAVHAGDERVRAEPFAAVELDLGSWWIE